MDKSTLTLVVSLFGVATSVFTFLYTLAALKFKVDQLWHEREAIWQHNLNRATEQGIRRGMMKKNSPVRITDEAREWFGGLATELRNWYADHGRGKRDIELMKDVSDTFGKRIAEQIAVPHDRPLDACILAALLIAKEPHERPAFLKDADQRPHA